MNFLAEYKNKDLVLSISKKIKQISKKNINLMEVCGGHTAAIHKYGLIDLLPPTINLISGPGCPVCVSHKSFIDKCIAMSKLDDVVITTFGDLIRVPGSSSSLEVEKANGMDIRIVYSSLDAIEIAKNNPDKKVVFLGIGFETTAPTSAAAVVEAYENNLNNFYLLSSHKIMPPAMTALIDDGVTINGYICPGHVSTITGSKIYKAIVDNYHLGCVVSGFEPVDIMQTILMLTDQFENNKPELQIEYSRSVTFDGNIKAQNIMNEVFYCEDDYWRGLGIIKLSGLKIKDKYEKHNAEKMIPVETETSTDDKGCICGLILKGLKKPVDCSLFKKLCTPENPVGACMVSGEGSCNVYYKYN